MCDIEACFFTDRILFLCPNQHCQSTEGLMGISFYRQQDAWLAVYLAMSTSLKARKE